MQSKMRRNLAGTFVARNLGRGAWRLTRREAAPIDIFLRGADAAATEAFRGAVSDVGIDWNADTVVLTMISADRRRSVNTQSTIVHEPLAHLYDALPLPAFDRRARRFWRRVFLLVRMPGGRYLLGVLARRVRK